MDAFTRNLGITQGRVEDVGVVLGNLAQGRDANLVPGDFAEVLQQVDLTGVSILRVRGRFELRGAQWELSVLVDGRKLGRLEGRTRVVTDLGADVSTLSGVHEIAVRLEYLAP